MSLIRKKYNKALREAQFVHADLEYHEAVFEEARKGFHDAVSIQLAKLSPDDREKIGTPKPTPQKQQGRIPEEVEVPPSPELSSSTALTTTDCKPEAEKETRSASKSIQIKKLYRKIAEATHPDRTKHYGLENKEIRQRTDLFRKATTAFRGDNWYLLQDIAVKLEIELPEPTKEQIKWVYEDVERTKSIISEYHNKFAWVWYDNEEKRDYYLRLFFSEILKFKLP